MSLTRGSYTARLARPEDRAALQALRARCFRGGSAPASGDERAAREDFDRFDDLCRHVVVEREDPEGGAVPLIVCCFRILEFDCGAQIDRSYSAQFYDLGALVDYPDRMVEMGRFCIDPDHSDPDVLRLAWAVLTQVIDETGTRLLFGCSSFGGTDWRRYADSFTMLSQRHLAPARWCPRVKAPKVVRYAKRLLARAGDQKRALQTMPPLLRSYISMGGWVSDHAVIDEDLGTLHVFTGLEIAAIPPARARLLRAIAA